MFRFNQILSALTACVMMTASLAAFPTPLSTAFTYQGQLKLSGSPLNATADFQFTLFDALSGPNQIGSMVPVNNVSITNGLFTASLDFGATAFDGNDRFLQIAVRSPAGGGSFTTLTPRQRVAATPYALQTRGIFVDPNNNVGIGTMTPIYPLHIAADGVPAMVLQDTGPASTQSGFVSFRNDALTETGWVGYGTAGSPHFSILNARSGGDVELVSFSGSIRLVTNALALTVTPAGRIGIGTTSPVFPLEVESGTTAIVGRTTVAGPGVAGQALTALGIGVQGICDNVAGFDFFASGAGINYGAPSSIRWKHNIELINDPLEKVTQMRGVSFDWDAAHGGQHDVGFIGEEVGKVLPEVVAYEADGKFVTGMDYSKLTPLLVEAVKALRAEKDQQLAQRDAQIEQLRSDNNSLQQGNHKLNDRLTDLEAVVARLSNQLEKH